MIVSNFLSRNELLADIPEFVEEHFFIPRNYILEQLKTVVKILREDTIFFIEYPYVERYYRDTYYHYFSKKHIAYNRNSLRITIFSDKIDTEEYYSYKENSEIEKFYFGFITLRPTTYRIIGHTFISPLALLNSEFVCCLTKKGSLINGRKLSVTGFPFCSQDNEAITCSESAIINLFDYFGTKYSEYSTILPSQVAKILSKQSYQRQLPSQGLPTENISYVLKKLGFGTMVYSGNDSATSDIYSTNEFKELLYMYIESGIPVIGTLSSGKSHHAVLIIGRERIHEKVSFKKKSYLLKDFISKEKPSKRHDFSNGFTKLLVMNDNHPPYELVDFDNPITDEQGEVYKFKSFIVPLYSKVHLEAYQFKSYFFTIIDSLLADDQTKHIDFTGKEEYITRYFLTSSRSYKDYITKSPEVSDSFKTLIVDKSMPKFIWVGEIITGNEYCNEQKVKSIIVADATESGLTNNFIFATNSKYLILKNLNSYNSGANQPATDKIYQIFEFDTENFYTFTNNLKGIHTKWQS